MAAAKTANASAVAIRIERLKQEIIQVRVKGTAPLILNQWAESAIEKMRVTQNLDGRSATQAQKTPKDSAVAAEEATYRLPDGRVGIPAAAFKAAMVGAARMYDGLTMVGVKVLFYVEGEGPKQLVPITYESMTKREDLPRNANGSPDLRYRNQFEGWAAELTIHYIVSRIDATSIVALLDAGGTGGVGDWRPSSPKSATGSFGTFQVIGNE